MPPCRGIEVIRRAEADGMKSLLLLERLHCRE
jgi:hypothetical protein